ncbi:nickel transporter permease [Agromyces aerolatus]|uniref:nickel transporter permease n=1 Tax=Agromyces sp. LY-1074 TaxID=3074080 RepID=UPI002860B1D6|nr:MULTISPECIES: nickel transporter permease [unclassified Agromyces]MDR5700847.1 ABC transporter permease [Agromyces sp. LY-1074]MDR5707492.1 ABC transporter permease [Agromyces sp. LY-1358]
MSRVDVGGFDEPRVGDTQEDIRARTSRFALSAFFGPIAKLPGAGIASFIVVGLLLLLAAIGPLIAPYDPIAQNFSVLLAPPSLEHLFGTDQLGRDVFSRVLAGARISLFIGLAAVIIAVALGTLLGLLAGFLGGWVDTTIMRITDLFLAFPALILAMAVSAALGPSLMNVLIAVSVTWWPEYARLARSVGMVERKVQYVDAARVLGMRTGPILGSHVFPAAVPPLLVKATMDVGIAIVYVAGLSFIGLGVQPPTPEWGVMISEGRIYMQSAWWIATYPSLAILITGFAFNLAGESLRDALDPRQHTKRRRTRHASTKRI